MSLAPGKSDLKKHLSRHIHIEKIAHPLDPANLPDAANTSKAQVGIAVVASPVPKPLF